jgi:hypothetical protein
MIIESSGRYNNGALGAGPQFRPCKSVYIIDRRGEARPYLQERRANRSSENLARIRLAADPRKLLDTDNPLLIRNRSPDASCPPWP